MSEVKTVWAPCSRCHCRTHHNVLHSAHDEGPDGYSLYRMIECAGCKTISMEHSEYSYGGDPDDEGPDSVRYYPSPAARRPPSWSAHLELGLIEGIDGTNLGDLLEEIYAAVRGGQHRLAMMGVRAMFEQIMIAKIGDHGTFTENLKKFHDGGFVSTVQRGALEKLLQAGHATMHRMFKPREDDLTTALDIIEGVFAAIFVHPDSARQLAQRVPGRARSQQAPTE